MLQSACDNITFEITTMYFCIQLLALIIFFSLTISLRFCLVHFVLFCLPYHPLHADIDEERKRKELKNQSLCNSRCVVSC